MDHVPSQRGCRRNVTLNEVDKVTKCVRIRVDLRAVEHEVFAQLVMIWAVINYCTMDQNTGMKAMIADLEISAKWRAVFLACIFCLATIAGSSFGPQAIAQDAGKKSSNPFAGFGSDSKEPYEIDADELEVLDAEKIAILTGNVNVRQGTSLLKAPYLKVFYSDSASGGSGAESQGIRRLEARHGVYVESGTQVATGENADYDAELEELIMTGNVVLTDDGNVIKGETLYVNLRTGESRVTDKKSGRIKMILSPNSNKSKSGTE